MKLNNVEIKEGAPEEKVKIALNTCLDIASKLFIADIYVRPFVSNILDSIELCGDDKAFTLQQQEKIIESVKLLRK